eukprot:818528_1
MAKNDGLLKSDHHTNYSSNHPHLSIPPPIIDIKTASNNRYQDRLQATYPTMAYNRYHARDAYDFSHYQTQNRAHIRHRMPISDTETKRDEYDSDSEYIQI